MDLTNLCMGCMNLRDGKAECPGCGFIEGTTPHSPQHLPPRAMLAGKYLIGRVLGQGGFGITYLAWDINLNMKLAVKEYLPLELVSRVVGHYEVKAHSETTNSFFQYGLEKFLEEAKTLAQFVGHPNIVAVRDFFRTNGTAYLVMNHLEGLTMRDYIAAAGGKMPYPQVIEILIPVMDALKVVHRVGVLHRDISPDNIFVTTTGRVVLIDFGAARQAMGDKSRSLSIILKPGYTPEEQYRSRGLQGPWTDIYALGATIYRLITGRMPPESLDRLAGESLVPPSRLGVQIGDHEERVLLKAMEVRAGDRYRSVQDFQQALISARRPQKVSRSDARAARKETGKPRSTQPPVSIRPDTAQPTSARPVPERPGVSQSPPPGPAPAKPKSAASHPPVKHGHVSAGEKAAPPGEVIKTPSQAPSRKQAPSRVMPGPIKQSAPFQGAQASGPVAPAAPAPRFFVFRPLWEPASVENFARVTVLLALFASIACLVIYLINSMQFLMSEFTPGNRDFSAFYTVFISNNFALYISLPLYLLFSFIGLNIKNFRLEIFTLIIFVFCTLQCITNLINWLTMITISGAQNQAVETIFLIMYYVGWPLMLAAFLFLSYLFQVEGVGVGNVAISGNLLVLTGVACTVFFALVTFAYDWGAAWNVPGFIVFSLLIMLTLPYFLHFNFRQDEPLDEFEDTPDEPGTEQIILQKN